MKIVADLHLHSRFSRATSKELTLGNIAAVCVRKGVDVIGTGDAIHPIWLREIGENLQSAEDGLYFFPGSPTVKFLLTVEISLIYKQGDRTRRNHLLILLPSIETARKVQKKFHELGNITSDGRPIFGINARDLVEILLSIDRQIVVIPAHIWTPWFSLYGSKSGFDSLTECFGDLASEIKAVETGLSADPAMCWRVGDLDHLNIISSGDAHSPAKIMREATIIETSELSYQNIKQAIEVQPTASRQQPAAIIASIEFFPEEGKYHWSGHAACQIVQSTAKTRELGSKCPVCGRELTLGVEWRAEILATRSESDLKIIKKDGWLKSLTLPNRPPYLRLIPLTEIIAETVGVKSVASRRVSALYQEMTNWQSERQILLETAIDEIKQKFGEKMATAIFRVREENLEIAPGYDGIYGRINIWKDSEKPKIKNFDQKVETDNYPSLRLTSDQLGLFSSH